jgi:hypothetical protein
VQGFQLDNEAAVSLLRAIPANLHSNAARLLKQSAALLARPDQRCTSGDLVRLARAHDPAFSERLVHDWPVWGLLAPATPHGRGPNGGVGRTWSAPQTIVFLGVVATRARGITRRADLANNPIFRWLLAGDEWVPAEQVRRALTTWAHASRRLSQHRLRSDIHQHVLRYPDVQARLDAGTQTRPQLRRAINAAPTRENTDELAALIGRLIASPADAGSKDSAAQDIGEVRRHALQGLERGIDALPNVPDSLLAQTRARYLTTIQPLIAILQGEASKVDASEFEARFRTEGQTACANAVTHLGALIEELELAQMVDHSTRATVAFSGFLAQAALAQETSRTSITHAQRARSRRMHKRRS